MSDNGASCGPGSTRSAHEAPKGLRPSGNDPSRDQHKPRRRASKPPTPKTEWHLVCVTRKGSVSMLKNLDLPTARQTYQRLMPDTRPVKYIELDCNVRCWSGGGMHGRMVWDDNRGNDQLERVEIVGPEGVDLDPWHGVEPAIIDARIGHKHDVRAGYVKCDCTDRLKEINMALVAPVSLTTPPERKPDTDEARYARLYKDVPTAFWLEPYADAS